MSSKKKTKPVQPSDSSDNESSNSDSDSAKTKKKSKPSKSAGKIMPVKAPKIIKSKKSSDSSDDDLVAPRKKTDSENDSDNENSKPKKKVVSSKNKNQSAAVKKSGASRGLIEKLQEGSQNNSTVKKSDNKTNDEDDSANKVGETSFNKSSTPDQVKKVLNFEKPANKPPNQFVPKDLSDLESDTDENTQAKTIPVQDLPKSDADISSKNETTNQESIESPSSLSRSTSIEPELAKLSGAKQENSNRDLPSLKIKVGSPTPPPVPVSPTKRRGISQLGKISGSGENNSTSTFANTPSNPVATQKEKKTSPAINEKSKEKKGEKKSNNSSGESSESNSNNANPFGKAKAISSKAANKNSGESNSKVREPNESVNKLKNKLSSESNKDGKDSKSLENKKVVKEYDSFDEMNLRKDILSSIYRLGYEAPTLIQKKAIVPIKEGKNCVVQSQSGTGKTLTFSVGLLERVYKCCNPKKPKCVGLVLSPTRELAQQTYTVLNTLNDTDYGKDFAIGYYVGGTQVRADVESINRQMPACVVGTPGRIIHLMKNLNLSTVKIFVLDEADQMFQTGFTEQINQILSSLESSAQMVCVSATYPKEISDRIKMGMDEPVVIEIPVEEVKVESISHYFYKCKDPEEKFTFLTDLYSNTQLTQAVIFANSIDTVIKLYEGLSNDGHQCGLIHGKMETSERNKVFNSFKGGSERILIATDILARGVDAQGVSLVINFDFPFSEETYIHRVGRSGRFGRKGNAINLVMDKECEVMKALEKKYEIEISDLNEEDIFKRFKNNL